MSPEGGAGDGAAGGGGPWIRLMREEDLPQVAAIEGEAFSTPWSLETFRSLLGRPLWVALVLEDGEGGVAGYAILGVVESQGELANLAVRKEDRGRGLGRALLEAVLAEARRRGVDRLFLEVRRSNRAALALYRRRGFRDVGVRRNYYQNPTEDARVLVLELLPEEV